MLHSSLAEQQRGVWRVYAARRLRSRVSHRVEGVPSVRRLTEAPRRGSAPDDWNPIAIIRGELIASHVKTHYYDAVR